MKQKDQMSAECLLDILENLQGGVILCNYNPATQTSEVVYINRGWTDITGYTMEQLQTEKTGNPQALMLAEDKGGMDAQYAQQLQLGSTYELMYRITHRNGALRWVIDKGVTSILPDGRVQNKSIITEVTAIKEREERMALLAQTDQLTGLNNKATFTLLAQTTLKRRGDCRHAMLMLDIDGFKKVNDSCGHDFGDKVLAAVAAQLKNSFRGSDIVGRVGGDEFMVLMTDISGEDAVVQKARKLCAEMRSIQIPGAAHARITVSVGVTFFAGDKLFEPLYAEADAALYRAKSSGKNQCVLANAPPTDKEVPKK